MDASFADDLKKMVEQQIRRRGVKDPATLKAMLEVPRHAFVPVSSQIYAYADAPLPIGQGQTISQPYIVALMTEAAELTPDASVLEIGTGSGYAAAILSRMVNEVYTIERIASLASKAEEIFKNLQYQNIQVKVGDGTLGWKEKAPFDAILVTAGAPVVPESFLDQLKLSGRVIIPVGDAISQQLIRLRKTPENTYTREILESVRFVPLIGEQGWKENS